MNELTKIITPEVIQVAGVAGVALFLLIIGFLSAFFMLIKRSFSANKESQEMMLKSQESFYKSLDKQTDSIMKILDEIKKSSGKTIMDKSTLYDIFCQVAFNHTNLKMNYARAVLTKNDIYNRRDSIRINLDTKYKEITQKEICLFNKLNVKGENFGVLFSNWIDKIWIEFMGKVNNIMFSSDTIDQKLNDLKNLMDGALSDFWEEQIK